MYKFVCHGYSIITCLLRVKNIYRVHIWYSCISIHSLDFRSLTHLIINIHTILLPNLSGMVTGGENDRRRRTTTTTGPKRHQLNTIWHRVNTKLTSKQHQSMNADVILDTLTSFLIRWCHSRYTDVILDTLTSLLMRWRHSRYANMIRDTLTPFPFTKCSATFLIEQTTGPNFACSPLLWLYLGLPDRFLIFGLVPNYGPIPEFLKFFSYLGPALENWSFY